MAGCRFNIGSGSLRLSASPRRSNTDDITVLVKVHHGDRNIRGCAYSGGAEEVSCNFVRVEILREKKDAPRVAGLMPLRPAWVMGEINLTILGGRQSGLGNRCREPEELKAGKACMHAGQEEDLQVLRAATVRQKPKSPAHAQSSHTRPIHTHPPAPPGAHATQLQTGLSKERGLAGTRAQRNPQSGNSQAAVPRPSLPGSSSRS